MTFERVKLASALLVFGNRDETLVFEIVLPAQHSENYFRNANSAVAQNKLPFSFLLTRQFQIYIFALTIKHSRDSGARLSDG